MTNKILAFIAFAIVVVSICYNANAHKQAAKDCISARGFPQKINGKWF